MCDAAADAALIATHLPGRPVRVQWMREQEHAWEPFGPAMAARVRASLDASGRTPLVRLYRGGPEGLSLLAKIEW